MISLATLAEHLNATLAGDGQMMISQAADLRDADEDHVSVYLSAKWKKPLLSTSAGAVIISPQDAHLCPKDIQKLICDDPRTAWSRTLRLFSPGKQIPTLELGIHPTAIVAPSAVIDPTAAIGAYAIIDADARIAGGCHIGQHVHIGRDTRIGRDSILMPMSCTGVRHHRE